MKILKTEGKQVLVEMKSNAGKRLVIWMDNVMLRNSGWTGSMKIGEERV